MDLNKHNFSEENPAPCLAKSAITMIGSELLFITFPPNERRPNLDYPPISGDCAERMNCIVDYDMTEFKELKYFIRLRMDEIPLPGIDISLLEPDEGGYLPPHKLVTAYMDVDLYLGEGEENAEKAIAALEKLKIEVDDIFQVADVDDVTYKIWTDSDGEDESGEIGEAISIEGKDEL
eukprot:CAMPEP_0196807310 /NCGR_PEP_ID=MMETSP1362-20130617/7285_1 /TAXON_ID=163516 /ORGANISM="Leptocylindrus danicus, Strain CCMP1856" /LENGTH=177 /DNA_ID=CAMNT_0042181173 /DNA_START=144 /DNA_END=677 /DNA_ORIENTATION=+